MINALGLVQNYLKVAIEYDHNNDDMVYRLGQDALSYTEPVPTVEEIRALMEQADRLYGTTRQVLREDKVKELFEWAERWRGSRKALLIPYYNDLVDSIIIDGARVSGKPAKSNVVQNMIWYDDTKLRPNEKAGALWFRVRPEGIGISRDFVFGPRAGLYEKAISPLRIIARLQEKKV